MIKINNECMTYLQFLQAKKCKVILENVILYTKNIILCHVEQFSINNVFYIYIADMFFVVENFTAYFVYYVILKYVTQAVRKVLCDKIHIFS